MSSEENAPHEPRWDPEALRELALSANDPLAAERAYWGAVSEADRAVDRQDTPSIQSNQVQGEQ